MARSLPTTVAPIVKKKEVPILKKGAEGKLLVPDVKLKVSTSYVNISGSSASSYRNSPSRIARRTSEFSDGSMTSVTEEDELSFKSRPVETRAWSYENVLTYPCMVPPTRTERRLEKCMIDGVEREVEVEVELPLKRLFLFPGKEVR
jgi:hypothetical protein